VIEALSREGDASNPRGVRLKVPPLLFPPP